MDYHPLGGYEVHYGFPLLWLRTYEFGVNVYHDSLLIDYLVWFLAGLALAQLYQMRKKQTR